MSEVCLRALLMKIQAAWSFLPSQLGTFLRSVLPPFSGPNSERRVFDPVGMVLHDRDCNFLFSFIIVFT